MSDALKLVQTGLTLVQLSDAIIRLQMLQRTAIAAGQTQVTNEELDASFAGLDAETAALRAAIERAKAEGR